MFKSHQIYKRLFFLVLMIVLSCANIGFASFQYVANNENTSLEKDFNNKNNDKTATIIPLVTTGSIDYIYFDRTGAETTKKETIDLSDVTNLTNFRNVIKQYETNTDFNKFMNFDKIEPGYIIANKSDPIRPGIYSSPSSKNSYSLIIEVYTDIIYTARKPMFGGGVEETYQGSASIYLQSSTKFKQIDLLTISFADNIDTLTLETILLKQLKNVYNISNFSLIGFYESYSENIFSNFIENDFSFTNNTTLYAALYSPFSGDINVSKTSITTLINSTESGSLTIYANKTLEPQRNILNDYSYVQSTNSFSLGFSNMPTTISSGLTVDFSLNDGFKLDLNDKKYKPSSNPSYANPDTQANSKQYTIKLINDLYINGTLNLHSRIGNNTSSSMQSSISGGYVNLDLNGHNIYISSTGVLNSYGIIEDSVGGGKINVSVGGTLSSYVTIEDYKSGTSTTKLVDQKVFPFTNYFFPYIRCNVFIECIKTSQNVISTGIFNGIVSLKLINDKPIIGTIPIANMTLNFIGTGDNTFFKIIDVLNTNASNKSGVYLNFDFNENTHFENFSTTSYEYRYLTTIRNKWTFANLDISLNKITMDVASALGGWFDDILGLVGSLPSVIHTDEYVFPIPSYFDLNFTNSKFHFSQPVQMLPGASLYFDENSFVFLEYNSSRSAGLYSSGDAVNIFKNGDFIDQRKTSTSTNDLSSAALFNTKSIWQYSNQPSIYCLGTIVFTKGNSVSPYILTGAINFNRVAICDSNGANLQELNVDKSQLFSTLQNNNVNVKTYSYFIYPGNEKMSLKSYTLPLISYDSAYVYNSDGTNLTGTYNQDTGIFTDNTGSNYFFLNDQAFNLTDTSTTLAPLENFDSNQNYITYKGANYIYFGGCYWLATSISENIATININKANSDSPTAEVTYDTARNLWLK